MIEPRTWFVTANVWLAAGTVLHALDGGNSSVAYWACLSLGIAHMASWLIWKRRIKEITYVVRDNTP